MDSNTKFPFAFSRLYVDLLLRIDTTGKVIEVRAALPDDSSYVKYYGDYLATMHFKPGRFENKPVEQTLPVHMKFRRYSRMPELAFPVDSSGIIHDRDFYFEAFRLNGIEVPRIEAFPSYNFQFKNTISDSLSYPFFIVKLNLDETGRPTKIEKLTPDSLPFTEQILNAVNWGRYRPLEIRGKTAASEVFLLISHLPQVSYPTRVLTAKDSTLSLHDRLRVCMLPDTVGLMFPPWPRNIIENKFVSSEKIVAIEGEAVVQVAIDTLGKVKYLDLENSDKIRKMKVLALLPDLRFYPALDFNNRRQPFEGYLQLTFTASKTVEIDMTWLPH